jgi:hypothetical protein
LPRKGQTFNVLLQAEMAPWNLVLTSAAPAEAAAGLIESAMLCLLRCARTQMTEWLTTAAWMADDVALGFCTEMFPSSDARLKSVSVIRVRWLRAELEELRCRGTYTAQPFRVRRLVYPGRLDVASLTATERPFPPPRSHPRAVTNEEMR